MGELEVIKLAAFRARYPKAWLPDWLDEVQTLGHPSEYAAPGTQVWIAAIYWAMGDRSFCPLVQRDQERAEELVAGFGTPGTITVSGYYDSDIPGELLE